MYCSAGGFTRQGRPCGQGIVDWEQILPILGYFKPDLPISIEDHKWLFEVNVYDEHWQAHHPDLTPYEMGQVMKHVWIIQQKIDRGELPQVDEYEAIPFLDQLEERLLYGRDYLRNLVKKLGLEG